MNTYSLRMSLRMIVLALIAVFGIVTLADVLTAPSVSTRSVPHCTAPTLGPDQSMTLINGTWTVGCDTPAGLYVRTTPMELHGCWWQATDADMGSRFGSRIDFIELHAGEEFTTRRCGFLVLKGPS